jgi:hypothetical protein
MDLSDTEIVGLAGAVLCSDRRRERRGLLGPLETGFSRRAPSDRISAHVGNGDEDVIERGGDVGDALRLDDFL